MTGGEHRGASASDALFRPVRAANAFEETVERLLQAVRLGVVAPGERLPAERDLAARLGVSREKVRESLAALTGAGYLEVRRGRYGGTFVLSADPRPAAGAGRVAAVLHVGFDDHPPVQQVGDEAGDGGAGEAGAADELGAARRAVPRLLRGDRRGGARRVGGHA